MHSSFLECNCTVHVGVEIGRQACSTIEESFLCIAEGLQELLEERGC